jgi:LDH2 family malate/lactate/ureidoglycolate dehydrogenase
MLAKYHAWYRRGFIEPAAESVVVRDEGSTATADVRQGGGHHVSTMAVALAIAKARRHGVGFVAVHDSNRYGAATNCAMMALAHRHARPSMTNAPGPRRCRRSAAG